MANIIFKGAYFRGFARVKYSNNRWNIMDKSEKILCPKASFDFVGTIQDDAILVCLKSGRYTYVDMQGKYLFKKTFFWASPFQNGYAIIKNEDYQYNVINKQGHLLFPRLWFKHLYQLKNQNFVIKRADGMYNLANTKGELLLKING